MNFFDIFYDYIEYPEQARMMIARNPPLGPALIGFLIGGMGLALWEMGTGASLAAFGVFFGIFFLEEVISSFLLAAIISLFIAMKEPGVVENQNRAGVSLFSYFGLAAFAWALAVPAAILSRLNFRAYWIGVASMAAIAFANLALKACGVRAVYGFSKFKAWATLLILYATAAAALICLFLLGVGSFFLR